jgi:LacI family transcriptional regulator
MKRNPTIKDIAAAAGVSTTTVSMALNKRPRIGRETSKRILRIAKELNYHPNFLAKSLVSKRSHTIGLIITSITNPFYPELAKGIEDKAIEFGCNIILCSTNYDLKREKYYIDVLRGKGVDGIIFSSVEINDPYIKPLVEEDFPFILVNRRIHNRQLDKKIDYIVLDNFSGGYLAMEHLFKLGHRRTGIIAGTLNSSTAVERTDGAKALLIDRGQKIDPNLIVEAHFSKDLAYEATKKFLSMKMPPTAILAENDFMALGAREAVLESGLKMPEHVALVGFDDIAVTALKGVEITTVSQKKYEMGSLAVKTLIEKIENRTPLMGNQMFLQPKLVIRNSCGFSLHGYER